MRHIDRCIVVNVVNCCTNLLNVYNLLIKQAVRSESLIINNQAKRIHTVVTVYYIGNLKRKQKTKKHNIETEKKYSIFPFLEKTVTRKKKIKPKKQKKNTK